MFILNALSRVGVSFRAPKWMLNLLMFLRNGTSGVSMGVRVVIFDADGCIFLVKHSYIDGWYLPGGGIERWETPVGAAIRELREEARIIPKDDPVLHGIFLYSGFWVPDYVCCFVVQNWEWDSESGEQPKGASADGEIIDAGFFSPNGLPEGTSKSVVKRLRELKEGSKVESGWV